MALLALGLIRFLGIHSVAIDAPAWRDRQVAMRGEQAWKGTFSLVWLLGFVLIVYGYGQARLNPVRVYAPPVGLRHVALLLMLPVFPLFLATHFPGRTLFLPHGPDLLPRRRVAGSRGDTCHGRTGARAGTTTRLPGSSATTGRSRSEPRLGGRHIWLMESHLPDNTGFACRGVNRHHRRRRHSAGPPMIPTMRHRCRAALLAAGLAASAGATAADLPWARADLLFADSSAWPDVALLVQITDLDSYGGDSKAYDTSLPNPLNPFDCIAPKRPQPECWRVGLTMNGQALQVRRQQTVPDLDRLRVQYLWLLYRSQGEQGAQAPLDVTLSAVMRNGEVSKVPLKEDGNRLDPRQAKQAQIAASPWTVLMPLAERRLRAAEDALPTSPARDTMREQWATFTERDCQFQALARIKDADTCRYDHIRAQLDALRLARSKP